MCPGEALNDWPESVHSQPVCLEIAWKLVLPLRQQAPQDGANEASVLLAD